MEKKTILIVGDHADTCLLVSARLKAYHCHTVFAADALQAIYVALKERPDAILVDLASSRREWLDRLAAIQSQYVPG